jgi:dTDP-4-amino-4,6-dideoxygalactose transaminase
VPAAVVKAGLEPVLVDVDPGTLDFDQRSLNEVATRNDLLCIVPTHLFGVPVDVERVRTVCGPDVFVLEDAAQAFGLNAPDGRRLGTLGDAAIFSFDRGKHLSSGRGGAIATYRNALKESCVRRHKKLRSCSAARAMRTWIELAAMAAFTRPRLYSLPSSLPFLGLGRTEYSTGFSLTLPPSTAIGALWSWRERLDRANKVRVQVVMELERTFKQSFLTRSAALARFPVLLSTADQRTELLVAGRRLGLGISTMYPTGIHHVPELRAQFAGQRFPGAEALAARLVTLPTHEYVDVADCAALRTVYSQIVGQRQAVCEPAVVVSC